MNHGDGDLDAYMTFDAEGMVTSYGADGSVVRSGTYEFTPVKGNEWKVAELKTDAILWPWIINSKGTLPSQASWGSGVYDNGNVNSLGGWGEATFWHFKAK